MGLLDILTPKKNDTKPRAPKRDDLAKAHAEHAENLATRRARRAQTRAEVERLNATDTAGFTEAQLLELYEQKNGAAKLDYAVEHLEAQAETAEREALAAITAHDVAAKRAEFQKLEDYWATFGSRAAEIDKALGDLIIEANAHVDTQRDAWIELHAFEEAHGQEKTQTHLWLTDRINYARMEVMRARGSEDGSQHFRAAGDRTVEDLIPRLLGLIGS